MSIMYMGYHLTDPQMMQLVNFILDWDLLLEHFCSSKYNLEKMGDL